MPNAQKHIDSILLFFQSIVISLAVFTLSPLYETVPHRDSGNFIFIGSQLLKGKILYQQTWDNKQPLLYAINAAGLWLGGGSAWGVWALELALFIIATVLMYLLLRKLLSPATSLGINLVTFLTIYQIMSGNFSEEYAIFFQMALLAVLFLFYFKASHHTTRSLAALGMGLLVGLIFCIKQTYIDLAAAIVLYLLFLAWLEKDTRRLIDLLWAAVGFFIVNAAVIVYFAAHGALNDYIIDAFLINKYYSSQGLLEWLHSIKEIFLFNSHYPFLLIMEAIWLGSLLIGFVKCLKFLGHLSQKPAFKWVVLVLGSMLLALFAVAQLRGKSSGMGLIEWTILISGLIMIVLAVISFASTRMTKQNPLSESDTPFRNYLASFDWAHPGAPVLFFLGLIDLPFVALMISLSGQNFPHYYISLFTPLFLLLSAAVLYIREQFGTSHYAVVIRIVFLVILFIGIFSPTRQVIARLQSSGNQDARLATATYLKSVTTPQQKILQWGWESGIYFMADREPPTKYSFQFPAYFNSPYQEEVLATLLSDIQADPPAYIADMMDESMPFIQGKSTAACLSANPANGTKLQVLLNYVCSHYEYIKSVQTINIFKHIR